eukprot:TRINITY_DN47620_c0_g1_i1.p1 TRINITY_DN47620_c0_g1~~TRINITY_DN47620_c0_g1_i1.p1  ORF type:complete len:393 (-),score=86.41 TRINITY_DN47620_c0_g1_i1:32-1210(-)
MTFLHSRSRCESSESLDLSSEVRFVVRRTFLELERVEPTRRRRLGRACSDSALLLDGFGRSPGETLPSDPGESEEARQGSLERADACDKASDSALAGLSDTSTEYLRSAADEPCWDSSSETQEEVHVFNQQVACGEEMWAAQFLPMGYDGHMQASPEVMQEMMGMMGYGGQATWWMPMDGCMEASACGALASGEWQWPGACPADAAGMVDGLGMCDAETAASSAQAYGKAFEEQPTVMTTVMLRNLPNCYSRRKLLELLDGEGFARTYDFAYSPVDFSSQAGLGYAFVNFMHPDDAERCRVHFDGFSKWDVESDKVCSVMWAGPHQGLHQHIERYRNSPVMHESVPDEWKPAVFVDGSRIQFPPPTQPVRKPQPRRRPENGSRDVAAGSSCS